MIHENVATKAAKMKLCADCRWIQPRDDIQQSRRGHSAATRTTTTPIDGSKREFQISRQQFRLMIDGCDVEGKLWAPKQSRAFLRRILLGTRNRNDSLVVEGGRPGNRKP